MSSDQPWVKVSFLTLRRVVGILGVLLPVVLVLGTLLFTFQLDLRSSISAYYDSVMGPAFAGILFVVGWFLFAYKGHDKRDDRAGDLACVFAMGVALFPHESTRHVWVPWVHYASAAALFLTLAYYSFFLFTLSDKKDPGRPKRIRNRVYRTCGVAMVVFIALIGAYNLANHFLGRDLFPELRPIFWLETFTLWAFGFSWFVKGDTLWTDAGEG